MLPQSIQCTTTWLQPRFLNLILAVIPGYKNILHFLQNLYFHFLGILTLCLIDRVLAISPYLIARSGRTGYTLSASSNSMRILSLAIFLRSHI